MEDVKNGVFTLSQVKNKNIEKGFREVYRCINRYKSVEELMREAEDEYVKLFLGPGKAEVMPYQSIYEGHRIYGETTLKIKSIYSRAGIRIPPGTGLSEDHLGVELQFIAHLCDRAIDLMERGENVALALSLELQKKFLEENLLPWVQEFCEDVLQTRAANFYRGIVRVTVGFLEEDRALLHMLLAQL